MKKLNLINKISMKMGPRVGKAGLVLKKYSPEIALAAGIGGVIGTVILACTETTKVDAILERHHERLERLQEGIDIIESGELDEEGVVYTQNEIGRDKFIFYSQTVKDFAKLYAPAFIVGTISIGLILWSHGVMRKRYLGAIAAFNAVSEAFNQYRERVRAEGGEDLDRHYMYGTERKEITTVDENGKKKKETVESVPEGSKMNEYTRLWAPEETREYIENPNNALMFLRGNCRIANNILQTRGKLFLNEVLDMLGYEMTPIGAVVGWVKGNKDDYVDFGIFDDENPLVKAFITGKSRTVPLEFNVDGPILELI